MDAAVDEKKLKELVAELAKNTDRNQARISLTAQCWNPLQHPQPISAGTIKTTPLR